MIIRLRQPTLPVNLVWSADGRRVAATHVADKNTSLWDVTSATLINRVQGDGVEFTSIAFSPDGRFLASALYHSNGQTHNGVTIPLTSLGLLAGRTGAFLRRVPPLSGLLTQWQPLNTAAPNPGERFVAARLGFSGGVYSVALYDPRSWEPMRFLETPEANELRDVLSAKRHLPPFFYHGPFRVSPERPGQVTEHSDD